MDKDGKDWWGGTDGFSSKGQGYEDFKKDSDSFQEKEGGESRGERSEWKQYDDKCYSDSKEEWGGYSDYEREDSERGDAYKDWGGYSDYEREDSEGESEDIKTSSSYFLYDDDLRILEQDNKRNPLSQNNYVTKYKAMSKQKNQVTSGNKGSDQVGFLYSPIPNQIDRSVSVQEPCQKKSDIHLQNNVNTKMGMTQQKKEEEWRTKENPYRHYIKPEKGDYEEVSVIWIIVFVIMMVIKYCRAIRRIVKFIRLLGR